MEAIRMTENEIGTFEEKLKAFGDQLTPKEQVLFAEVLMRAASADHDVEGYGIPLLNMNGRSWSDIRKNMGSVLLVVLEEIGKNNPYGTVPPIS